MRKLLLASALLVSIAQAQVYRERSEASWEVTLPETSTGYSAIRTTNPNETLTDIVEPNLPGIFAIGFDTFEPKTTNPFNGDGNIFGRPEREISLHWDGREIANRLSPVEMKTGKPVRYRVKMESVVGGTAVSVWVENTAVYDNFFIPGMKPVEGRWTFGTESGVVADRYRATVGGKQIPLETPTHVSVFDKETNDKSRHRFEKVVHLPEKTDEFGRIVGTLTLGPTPAGIDPWDRIAQIWLTDEKGERFEVLRYITPYRKGWTWKVDLTHLMPLLSGDKTFKFECETYAEGWLVSFDLDYYKGDLKPRPVQVLNVWNGTAVLGQPDKFPLTDILAPKSLSLGGYRKAEFWATVTGHGMDPNTDNAAEFLSLWRKLTVDTKTFENTLWKTDVYLNPCRPQGGTWKYDRAGWAPGDVVTPWTVEITRAVRGRGPTTLSYEIQPYTNHTPAEGNPARHIIESVVVLYK